MSVTDELTEGEIQHDRILSHPLVVGQKQGAKDILDLGYSIGGQESFHTDPWVSFNGFENAQQFYCSTADSVQDVEAFIRDIEGSMGPLQRNETVGYFNLLRKFNYVDRKYTTKSGIWDLSELDVPFRYPLNLDHEGVDCADGKLLLFTVTLENFKEPNSTILSVVFHANVPDIEILICDQILLPRPSQNGCMYDDYPIKFRRVVESSFANGDFTLLDLYKGKFTWQVPKHDQRSERDATNYNYYLRSQGYSDRSQHRTGKVRLGSLGGLMVGISSVIQVSDIVKRDTFESIRGNT